MGFVRLAVVPVALAVLLHSAGGAPADDRALLAGIKEGKLVFDITEGDGKALVTRLESIEETRQDLIKHGITPRFVVSFRGPATLLVQSDLEKVKPEARPYVAQIASMLAQMGKTSGFDSLEQCGVAVRHAGTKAENVIPPLKVVANSFVTLMAYQAKGYAYIRG